MERSSRLWLAAFVVASFGLGLASHGDAGAAESERFLLADRESGQAAMNAPFSPATDGRSRFEWLLDDAPTMRADTQPGARTPSEQRQLAATSMWIVTAVAFASSCYVLVRFGGWWAQAAWFGLSGIALLVLLILISTTDDPGTNLVAGAAYLATLALLIGGWLLGAIVLGIIAGIRSSGSR